MNLKLIPLGFIYTIVLITILCVFIFTTITFSNIVELVIPSSYFKQGIHVNILSSFIGGILLAGIFFIFLRPRVAISPHIAKRFDKKNNETFYSFKFINTSLFAAFDVNIEAYVCYEIGATNNGRGMNVRTKKVPLRRSNWIYLANWKAVFPNTVHAPHCILISTQLKKDFNHADDKFVEDIQNEIESNSNYLEFRITLKHAFSNLSSTYRTRYNTSDCVKEGKFEFGNSLTIV